MNMHSAELWDLGDMVYPIEPTRTINLGKNVSVEIGVGNGNPFSCVGTFTDPSGDGEGRIDVVRNGDILLAVEALREGRVPHSSYSTPIGEYSYVIVLIPKRDAYIWFKGALYVFYGGAPVVFFPPAAILTIH
jgi:hypothetical protein